MPELPEVETVARGLAAVWDGCLLTRVECRRTQLRQPLPVDFVDRLQGRRVLAVGRRAKYLLVRLDGNLTLLGHLGMSGSMVIERGRNEPPGKHDHVTFWTDQGVSVTYRDPRRFGLLDLCPSDQEQQHPLLRHLGPEPLESDFTPDRLAAGLAGKRSPVKTVLLDQTVLVGLGNIYVSESLFQSGLLPTRPAASLSMAEIHALFDAIQDVLRRAIAAGGSTLKDHVQPNGELGYFQHNFAVYGRAGQSCPGCDCGDGAIVRLVQAGRSTFYCPKRQR